jgi:DNA-binding XRE family transcriptional regulator
MNKIETELAHEKLELAKDLVKSVRLLLHNHVVGA